MESTIYFRKHGYLISLGLYSPKSGDLSERYFWNSILRNIKFFGADYEEKSPLILRWWGRIFSIKLNFREESYLHKDFNSDK